MKRILLITLLAYSTCLLAQEKKDTTELTPVEVRAVRANATAPFAKTNISRKDIEAVNLAQDLPFLLNQTPSTVVNSDAGNGIGYTGIRIRGTDGTRINVTLNGIPYNDAESQMTYFVDLPDFASSVNSIQIQRGVGTSTNGAGAFGATINLSTNEVNWKPYAESNNSYGSFNTWRNTIRTGTGLLGKHFTTDLRLSRISSDGYIDRASTNLKSFYVSSAYLSDKTDIRINIFSGQEKTYQAWYGVSEADLKTNRRINYAGTEKPGTPYDNQTDNYQQDHYQLFFTQRFSPALSFNTAFFLTKGKGYYEQYKAAQDYADYGQPYPVTGIDTTFTTDLVRQLWLDNNFYGSIFSLQHASRKTRMVLGGAITKYDGTHYANVTWAARGYMPTDRYYNLKAYKNDLNFYAKWQQDLLPSLQFFADMQYRKVGYDLKGFEEHPGLVINKDYNFFNPKTGFTWHKNKLIAYASFSAARKEPNRDDFEAGIEQQPKPEQLYDYELGLEKSARKLSYSANLYYMKYHDQLVLTGMINNVGAYTRTNIPKSYRLGIELQAGAKLEQWLRLDANLSLSRNRILDFTEYIDDYDNGGQKSKTYKEADISFSPNIIGGATLTVTPVTRFSLSLLSKYVGRQYLDNTGNPNRSLDPYFTGDLRASYTIRLNAVNQLQLVGMMYNAFNALYEPNGYTYSYYSNTRVNTENYYFPMAGRNYMIAVNLKF